MEDMHLKSESLSAETFSAGLPDIMVSSRKAHGTGCPATAVVEGVFITSLTLDCGMSRDVAMTSVISATNGAITSTVLSSGLKCSRAKGMVASVKILLMSASEGFTTKRNTRTSSALREKMLARNLVLQ